MLPIQQEDNYITPGRFGFIIMFCFVFSPSSPCLWIPVKSNKLVGKVCPPPPSPAGSTGRSSAGLHSMPVRFQSQVLSVAEQSFLVRVCVCVYVAWPHQLFIVDYRQSISLDLGLLLLLFFTTSITTKFKNAVSEEMESIHVAAYIAGSNINQLLSVWLCVCVCKVGSSIQCLATGQNGYWETLCDNRLYLSV